MLRYVPHLFFGGLFVLAASFATTLVVLEHQKSPVEKTIPLPRPKPSALQMQQRAQQHFERIVANSAKTAAHDAGCDCLHEGPPPMNKYEREVAARLGRQ